MRKEDVMILGLAALVAWALVKKAAPAMAAGGGGSQGETLIMEWNGWRYYSGGTVIGPDGSYYAKDNSWYPVWTPGGTYST